METSRNEGMSFGLCGMMTWGSKIRRRQEEGRITQTSSETHSVILDAPPISTPIGRGSKTSYSWRDNRNSLYDSYKFSSVLHFKDEEVIFNFLQIHSYLIVKTFTMQNVNRY